MRCCICGSEIVGESFDPHPLCGDEENARCCNMCYTIKVMTARALLAKHDKPPINIGDTIMVLYSPHLDEDGSWVKGVVTDVRQEGGIINHYGTWGSFPLNREKDVYVKVDG